jgi:hypothetical protein
MTIAILFAAVLLAAMWMPRSGAGSFPTKDDAGQFGKVGAPTHSSSHEYAAVMKGLAVVPVSMWKASFVATLPDAPVQPAPGRDFAFTPGLQAHTNESRSHAHSGRASPFEPGR